MRDIKQYAYETLCWCTIWIVTCNTELFEHPLVCVQDFNFYNFNFCIICLKPGTWNLIQLTFDSYRCVYSETCLQRRSKAPKYFAAGNFRFMQVIFMWLLRTPDRRDCKSFPLETGVSCLLVPFDRGSFKDRFYCTLYRSIRMRLCQPVPQVLSAD